MELRILVIDPGETCGYAVFQLEKSLVAEARPSDLELLETWEDQGASIPEFVIPFLQVLRRVKPSLVLIEDYRVFLGAAMTHVGQQLITSELIGAVIGVCALTVPPMRTARIAASKKGKWPEVRMKAKFPQAGRVTGHARDAVKLGLAFLEGQGLWAPVQAGYSETGYTGTG